MTTAPFASPPLELTARALITGVGIGIILALSNVYMGMKTGWWDAGAVTASLVGYVILSPIGRSRRSEYTMQENNITQATAISVSSMPSTIGLMGAIPALGLMGLHYSNWGLMLWGIGVGLFGVCLSVALRQRLIVEENLPFPMGRAAGEVIKAFHSKSSKFLESAWALLGSGLFSGLVTWFRDGKPRWIPAVTYFPGKLFGTSLASLNLGFAWMPLMFGTGMLIGLRGALSLLLGAILSFVVIGPQLINANIVHEATYEALSHWLTWPGVGFMIGGTLPLIYRVVTGLGSSFRDLKAARNTGTNTGSNYILWVGVFSAALMVTVSVLVFNVPWFIALLGVGLSVIFTSVCARSTGETDITPLGAVGQMSQMALGLLNTGSAATGLMGGAMTGAGAETAYGLGAFRTTRIVGGSGSSLTVAQIIGVLVGSLVSLPAYQLLEHAYPLGSATLPVPWGQQWKTVAELVTGGVNAMPPYALQVAVLAFIIGLSLALVELTKYQRWIPSPMSIGLGFLLPASYFLPVCVGAAFVEYFQRENPEAAERYCPSIAAGAMAAESLVGFFAAALVAAGWIEA